MANNKNRDTVQRAWNFLRLAFLWARKGRVFRRRLTAEFRVALKKLGHKTPSVQLHYCERQLSFEETPIFNIKMHRPAALRFHIPCINPPVDFDYDFDGDDDNADDGNGAEIVPREEEEEIDLRAEEFTAQFYKQMKLQRQISYVQYDDIINKPSS